MMHRPGCLKWVTAATAVLCIGLSVAILVTVGAAGSSAATVTVDHAGRWPPWFGSAHPSALTVTAALWMALLLGVAGVATGLAAIRRGWRPAARWLIAGSLVAAIALAVVPAVGSTDMLDYAAYGRITVLHHSPYAMTPEQLRRTSDPVGRLAPRAWEHVTSVYGPLATASEWAAAELGGSSAARTIFWLKVWNGLAFCAVVLALDWLTRLVPAVRARAHLLWSVNPLMLWAVMAGGHVDGLATGLAVLALAVLGRAALLAREPGRIGTGRAFATGLLLGAATAVNEAGKKGTVKIVSMDRGNEVLDAIKEGVISASIAQQTALMPFYALQILYNLKNNPVPISNDNASAHVTGVPAVVDTGVIVIDQSNYQNFVRK